MPCRLAVDLVEVGNTTATGQHVGPDSSIETSLLAPADVGLLMLPRVPYFVEHDVTGIVLIHVDIEKSTAFPGSGIRGRFKHHAKEFVNPLRIHL